jgi:hypothetical protein
VIYAPSTVEALGEFRYYDRASDTWILFDPLTVSCTVAPPPSGTPLGTTPTAYTFGVNPQMTRIGAGIYRLVYDVVRAGTYLETWHCVGTEGQVTERRLTEVA